MELNLKRPIVFFDLETTGTNIGTDRIVEISMIKLTPEGKEISLTHRVNPEMHIPEQSSSVHHIYDQDVAECPTFKQLAKEIADFIAGCDIAGYNSNKFDVPLLAEEFHRVGQKVNMHNHKFIDVQSIFYKMEPRTLSAAYRFYCNAELEGAHGANADTKATYEVLKAQLDKYPELQNDMDFLSDYSSFSRNVDFAGLMVYNDKNEPVFNFGKHKGKKVVDVLAQDHGYYGWVMTNNFTHDTKAKLTEIVNEMKK